MGDLNQTISTIMLNVNDVNKQSKSIKGILNFIKRPSSMLTKRKFTLIVRTQIR